MKTTIRNIISSFQRGLNLLPARSAGGTNRVVIAGYDSLSEAHECDIDRKLAGILHADIADYTRLTEEDEESTHRRLIESMELLRAEIAAHNGRVAHSAGDSILAEFADAESALRCAVNVQLASQQQNIDLDLSRQVRFRIGVNFGDVIAEDGDIYGRAVNLAARLEGLACSGGICVSRDVRTALAESTDFEFIALGKRYVRHISEPVDVFWIEVDLQRSGDADLRSASDPISVVS